MIIGTLGPEGTYSQKAAKQWDEKASIQFYDDIFDTVDALLRNEVHSSIVPIENSVEGSITLTLDLLLEHELMITGEVIVRINHCLLSKGKRENIKIIMSHPQALSQCRKYIKNKFKGVEIRSDLSTSHAAKHAAGSKEIAAIASAQSAKMYGLEILDENIQDVPDNFTRFIVIGKTTPAPTGNDKTSIIVYLEKNKPGALYEILGEFAGKNIDLTKIESRPTKKALGDYVFYIDIKGHIEDRTIRDTISRIKGKVGMLKVLGSYPAAK
jgi:prephenate dehydratase